MVSANKTIRWLALSLYAIRSTYLGLPRDSLMIDLKTERVETFLAHVHRIPFKVNDNARLTRIPGCAKVTDSETYYGIANYTSHGLLYVLWNSYTSHGLRDIQ